MKLDIHRLMYIYIYIYIYLIIYIWDTVNTWYIAPRHQFLKSALSFFRLWYISKYYRFLKSVLSFSKPQLNFKKIKMSRILLSINLNFGYVYIYINIISNPPSFQLFFTFPSRRPDAKSLDPRHPRLCSRRSPRVPATTNGRDGGVLKCGTPMAGCEKKMENPRHKWMIWKPPFCSG